MLPIKTYYEKSRHRRAELHAMEMEVDCQEIEEIRCHEHEGPNEDSQHGGPNEDSEEGIDEENDISEADFNNNGSAEEDGSPVRAGYESPDSEENVNCTTDLKELFRWTSKFNISEHCYSELTDILTRINLNDVPLDLRVLKTLMKCNECFSNVEVIDVGYIFKNKIVKCKAMYFGIANNIQVLAKNHNIPERIQLQVNVDGLPLWKSS